MASFTQFIRDGHYITNELFQKASQIQASKRNNTFYAALKELRGFEDGQLVKLACDFFGYHLVNNAFEVKVDFEKTEKIYGDIFAAIDRKSCVITHNDKEYVIIYDPEDESTKNTCTIALGSDPKFAICTDADFSIINQYQLQPRAVWSRAQSVKYAADAKPITGSLMRGFTRNADMTTSAVDSLLTMLMDAALNRRASDLHIQQLSDEDAQVLFRIDGKIYHYTNIDADTLPNLRTKLKTMCDIGGTDQTMPVEGQIKHVHNDVNIDVRVNVITTTKNRYDFTLRFISSDIRELDDLGLNPDVLTKYRNLLHMTKGLVIICGPTGCGKTSLLYAGFKELLRQEHQPIICSVEDPVEIVLPGVTQVDVKKEKKMTYAKVFPSFLRHDPDVITIGEVRTLEVAEQAIQSSNTGHLTFTTLHTNDALSAITRLTNLGLDPYVVGDVLAAIVAQRLIRRVCPHCAEEYQLPIDHEWRKRYNLGNEPLVLKKGKGCSHCAGTGYLGRMAVNEIVVSSPILRDAIQKNQTRTEIERVLESTPEGHKTYIEDAVEKALAGKTTFEEVDALYKDVL